MYVKKVNVWEGTCFYLLNLQSEKFVCVRAHSPALLVKGWLENESCDCVSPIPSSKSQERAYVEFVTNI